MGHMKNLAMMIQSGEIENLDIEYKKARELSKEEFYFQGRLINIDYAKHLLDYVNQISSTVRRD